MFTTSTTTKKGPSTKLQRKGGSLDTKTKEEQHRSIKYKEGQEHLQNEEEKDPHLESVY